MDSPPSQPAASSSTDSSTEINPATESSQKGKSKLHRLQSAGFSSFYNFERLSMESAAETMRSLSIEQFLLIFLAFADIIIQFSFVLNQGNEDRVNKDAENDPTETTNPNTIIGVQFALAILSLLALIISFFVIINGLIANNRKIIVTAFSIKLFSVVFFDIPCFVDPTEYRTIFLAIAVVLRGIQLSLLFMVLFRHSEMVTNVANFQRNRLDTINNPLEFAKASAEHHLDQTMDRLPSEWYSNRLEHLVDYVRLTSIRKDYRKAIKVGRRYFVGIALVILLVSMGTFIYEFRNIVSAYGEYFSDSQIATMEKNSNACGIFQCNNNETIVSHNPDQKVWLVILDGARLDYVTKENKEMVNFLKTLEKDSFQSSMRLQSPSMSVPHWIVLLSGSEPDMSGVLGNLLVPEIRYNSIFSMSKTHGNLKRGMSASPWMSDIVRSQLEYLLSDGTVPTSEGSNDRDVPTADPADYVRGNITYDALTTNDQKYKLFLSHFSDIDMQGHCCGVTKAFNKEDTYNKAITNKTLILEKIFEIVDNDTVVIITADHGHVDAGGHGGPDKVLTTIPLIIYKNGSNLGSQNVNFKRYRENTDKDPLQQRDIAATITGLLGLPVPRQSQGMFIDEALTLFNSTHLDKHRQDLFLQKQSYYNVFFDTILRKQSGAIWEPGYHETASSDDLIAATVELENVFNKVREEYIQEQILRNILLTFVSLMIIFAFLIYFFQVYTFCDQWAVMDRMRYMILKPFLKCCGFGWFTHILLNLEKTSYLTTDIYSENDPQRKAVELHKLDIDSNVFAMGFGFFFILLYYGACIAVYIIVYAFFGYESWDSTVIHTPAAIPRYLALVLFPASCIAYFFSRFYHSLYTNFDYFQDGMRFPAKIGIILRNIVYALNPPFLKLKFEMVYLLRYWILLWVTYSAMILFMFQATFSFLIPLVFKIAFTTTTWGLRFRILTVQLMSFPLILGTLTNLRVESTHVNKHSQALDGVYALKLRKDQRWMMRHKDNVQHLNKWDVQISDPSFFSETKTSLYRPIKSALHIFSLDWDPEAEKSSETAEESLSFLPPVVEKAIDQVKKLHHEDVEPIDADESMDNSAVPLGDLSSSNNRAT